MSIVQYSNLLKGIGNGYSNPAGAWLTSSILWQTEQPATYLRMSCCILGHQTHCCNAASVLRAPRCEAYAELCNSAISYVRQALCFGTTNYNVHHPRPGKPNLTHAPIECNTLVKGLFSLTLKLQPLCVEP